MSTLKSTFIGTAIGLLRHAEQPGTRQFILSGLAQWRRSLPVARDRPFHRAIALIHNRAPAARSVHRLSMAVGISRRQLQRIFQKRLGVSPKVYLRFFRFEQTFRFLERHGWVPLSAVAFSHGYADAAHLIREFRAFTGVTPRTLLKEACPVAELEMAV
ncbi:helix-turn-helix domain-containing protein [Neolewinella litorea]|uniref:AraC family transcriptional regulator n=1 Tax=Neolewinella litorea TaxID=2562452 RepID=A0A4S4NKL7_9BACT|nr:helix-turn-helix domain-containing protein [Neolewinella litorea]THH39357.1 AraC family transcriptional regulator [Neolewinella litorea]